MPPKQPGRHGSLRLEDVVWIAVVVVFIAGCAGRSVGTVAVDWKRARGRRTPGGRIYVGTDRGVFLTILGASGWHRFGQGLPNTLVSDLRITPVS